MIRRRELARALARANVTEWTIVERAQELGVYDDGRGLRRNEQRTRATVVAHQDQPSGRGSVRLDIAAHDDARQLVAHALRLATAAIGPAWKSPPPAAPAKVELYDRTLEKQELVEAAASALRPLRLPQGHTLSSRIEVLREKVSVQSRAGLDATWTASEVRAELVIIAGAHSLALTRHARRLADLALDSAIADAAKDLERLANAAPPTPGPCALVLSTDAMLHGERGGVWSIFAAQADGVLEHQGLTRYRLGAPITTAAPSAPEPLSIASDGALPFAIASAPVSDEGDAVRRFAIVERGVAAGLGLSAREAASRRRDPNGGVKNLVVVPGTWNGALPPTRTVEIRRLRALAIDTYTGDATLEIALGIEHDRGVQKPFAGGTIRLDLVAALALARRSASVVSRGSYAGPASVLVERAELSA